MEIAFNVPFITIPVKKSVDATYSAMANVNIGAIILGGAIAFGFAVVIPGVLFLFNKKNYHTKLREADSGIWRQSIDFVESLLTANQIDGTACFQQCVCEFVKKSAKSVTEGRSSSTDQIINGLATNEWLLKLIDGTTLKKARDTGLKNYNCSKIYNCKVNQKSVENLKQTLTTLLGGYF